VSPPPNFSVQYLICTFSTTFLWFVTALAAIIDNGVRKGLTLSFSLSLFLSRSVSLSFSSLSLSLSLSRSLSLYLTLSASCSFTLIFSPPPINTSAQIRPASSPLTAACLYLHHGHRRLDPRLQDTGYRPVALAGPERRTRHEIVQKVRCSDHDDVVVDSNDDDAVDEEMMMMMILLIHSFSFSLYRHPSIVSHTHSQPPGLWTLRTTRRWHSHRSRSRRERHADI